MLGSHATIGGNMKILLLLSMLFGAQANAYRFSITWTQGSIKFTETHWGEGPCSQFSPPPSGCSDLKLPLPRVDKIGSLQIKDSIMIEKQPN